MASQNLRPIAAFFGAGFRLKSRSSVRICLGTLRKEHAKRESSVVDDLRVSVVS
jgi:hypothetical protein